MKNIYFLLKLNLFINVILLFSINNLSAKWESLNGGLPQGERIWSVVVDENNPSHLFASVWYDVYFSSNYGDKWTKIENFPKASGLAFIIKVKYPHIIIAINDFGLHISNDYGKSWLKKESLPVYRPGIFSAAIKGDTMFLGTELGISMSPDAGNTWIDLVPKPPNDTVLQLGSVKNLLIKNEKIYATHGMRGVICSTNSGLSWKKISDSKLKDRSGTIMLRPSIDHIFFLNDILYAYNGAHLWSTTDDGVNWELINVFPSKGDSSFGGFVACNSSIFTGNGKLGFFISTNYGKSFHTYNNGFPFKDFGYICYNDKYAYLSTGIIYRAPIKDCEFIESNDVEDRIHLETGSYISISPNPAGEYIEISGIGVNPRVNPWVDGGVDEIKIYNVLGECVMSVQAGLEPAPTVGVDVSGLSPGIYFVRLGNQVMKFVKI